MIYTNLNEYGNFLLNKFLDPLFAFQDLNYKKIFENLEKLGADIYLGNRFFAKNPQVFKDSNLIESSFLSSEDIFILISAIYAKLYNISQNISEDKENLIWMINASFRLCNLTYAKEEKEFGKIKKIKLISNKLFSDKNMKKGQEIEQRIFIDFNGNVELIRYKFVDLKELYHETYKANFQISEEDKDLLFDVTKEFLKGKNFNKFSPGIGNWYLELTDENNKIIKLNGPLIGIYMSYNKSEINLTEVFRNILNNKEIWAFGNYESSHIIENIKINFRRIKAVEAEKVDGEIFCSSVYDNEEFLLINRKNESIYVARALGDNVEINKEYKIKNRIGILLDYVSSLKLTQKKDKKSGKKKKVIPSEIDNIKCKITIDYRNLESESLEGDFNIENLPKSWLTFIKLIKSILSYYDEFDIFNIKLAKKVPRHEGDLIYLSVVFKDSYKKYNYITEDDTILEDDYVLVPTGKENIPTKALVIDKNYYNLKNAPYPPEKTKKIIKKLKKEEKNEKF